MGTNHIFNFVVICTCDSLCVRRLLKPPNRLGMTGMKFVDSSQGANTHCVNTHGFLTCESDPRIT